MGSGGCAGSPLLRRIGGERVLLHSLGRDELMAQHELQQENYAALRAKKLALDLTRGKPCSRAARPVQRSAEPARRRRLSRRRRHRHPQLRRPARAARVARDLRRAARHPGANLIAGNNSSLEMMHDIVTFSMLHGGVDSPRPWSQEPVRQVPAARRPATTGTSRSPRRCGIEMITDPDARRRPRRRPHRGARRRRSRDQGHVGGAGVLQSDRCDLLMGGGAPAGSDAHGGTAISGCSGTTPTACTRSPTTSYARSTCWVWRRRRATRTGRTCSRRPARSRSPEPESASSAGRWATSRGICSTRARRPIGPDKVNQLRHLRFLGDADGVRLHMQRHQQLLAPKFALALHILEDRLGRLQDRVVDRAEGRLLHQPRRAARYGPTHHRAGQGRRYRGHRGRRDVPVPKRPRGQEHSARADVPVDAGPVASGRRTGHLRAAGGHRVAAAAG